MRNLTLSLLAIISISTFTLADSYPAEGPNSYKSLVDNENSGPMFSNRPYVGIGYSYMNTNVETYNETTEVDISGNSIMILMGLEINRYFSIEGRYTDTLGDLDFDISGTVNDNPQFNGSMSNIGIYLKPMYQSGPVGLYGLIGFGQVRFDIDNVGTSSENEFQWGVGISFDAGNSIFDGSATSLFVDYTRFYQDEYMDTDLVIDAVNFGIAFKF